MRLVKLSSSIKTFKTLEFNPEGFTIILANKTDDSTKNDSLNGVGKSLIVYLIHFCLGCSSNLDLKKKLPDEYFELEFEINSKMFKSRRLTSDQEFILLNNDKLKLSKFKDKMEELVFPESSTKFLAFRNLISRFIRPYSYSYGSWNKWLPKEDKNDHVPFLNTLYLFGIDPEITSKKFDLRERLIQYDAKRKAFKTDPILKEYFSDTNKDLSVDIETIKREINSKEFKLTNLNFSKDYYDIEAKSENISIEIRKLNNHKILLYNALVNIDESLKRDFGKNSDFVKNAYNLLESSMKTESLNEFQKVIDFHSSLMYNRKKRLNDQKKKILNDLEFTKINLDKHIKEHNSYLNLLNKNAPFEQGLAIKEELNLLKNKLKKLSQYEEIIDQYNSKISDVKKDLEEENKRAEEYSKSIKELRINLDEKFKELVKNFYGKKNSYLTIKNNIGENTIRFNLAVKIDDDSSNGVREIELFCFDLLLFLFRQNTPINFIFHDSRIFANVDPSQMATALNLILNYQKEKPFQYIVSLNKNQYEEIKDAFESNNQEVEFNEIFNDKTIKLKLDQTNEGKLLGFQKNIDYDIN